MNYGIAISDIDGDGQLEALVAGFGYPNLALKWVGDRFEDVADPVLADENRQAIGLAACDLDNDGGEEIYILNTDTFGGAKRLGDRLFDYSGSQWVDLFSVPAYQGLANMIAGRSVACVDRFGNGRYGFFVANYGGPMCFYELDDDGNLRNVAAEAGVDLVTGGRSVVALPLVSERMDIFVGNEMGSNFLFRNRGDGTFENIASLAGVSDPAENVRGIAILDNEKQGFDLVYGNWEGPHRLFVQARPGQFENRITPLMAVPSRVRTVIAADFDNDGHLEVFFNNLGQANRLFGWRQERWVLLDIGEAAEPTSYGTGAAVGDFDGDGRLELLVAHGESGMQPLSLYHTVPNGNHWLRIQALTAYGAPARGAVVKIRAGERVQKRVIDSGSGYLCQMEPVAHFGLGQTRRVEAISVQFPDGKVVNMEGDYAADQVIAVPHPDTRLW
jgi:hypothetical protein